MTKPANISQLAQQFDIPGILQIIAGNGGLPCLDIQRENAKARIYLHGAHVTDWQPAGQHPVLFTSSKSLFEPGKPIRGGVPLCFPWFGPKQGDLKAAAHGFVRLQEWRLESTRLHDTGAVEVVLALDTTEQTRTLWPAEATVRHRIIIGSALQMTLEVHNRGGTSISFEEAQHTYLTVGDVRDVRVQGLAEVTYIDKVDGARQKVQEGPIIITQETDRVYLGTSSVCVVDDPVLKRKIRVEKENSNTTVVWNPWIAKAKAMTDFGDEEWPGMLCIETSNVADYAVRLEAGQTHRMTTRITVESQAQ